MYIERIHWGARHAIAQRSNISQLRIELVGQHILHSCFTQSLQARESMSYKHLQSFSLVYIIIIIIIFHTVYASRSFYVYAYASTAESIIMNERRRRIRLRDLFLSVILCLNAFLHTFTCTCTRSASDIGLVDRRWRYASKLSRLTKLNRMDEIVDVRLRGYLPSFSSCSSSIIDSRKSIRCVLRRNSRNLTKLT